MFCRGPRRAHDGIFPGAEAKGNIGYVFGAGEEENALFLIDGDGLC